MENKACDLLQEQYLYSRSNHRRCSHEAYCYWSSLGELYSMFRWYHSPNKRKSDFVLVQLLSLMVYQSEVTIFIVLLFVFVTRSLYFLSIVRSRWEEARDSDSKRVRHLIPQVTLHLIYRALTLPLFNYCNAVWELWDSIKKQTWNRYKIQQPVI